MTPDPSGAARAPQPFDVELDAALYRVENYLLDRQPELAKPVIRARASLGALVQAVEDQQRQLEIVEQDYENCCRARKEAETLVAQLRADGQRLQRELNDIRASGLCGYRFDHTVCVGRAGHTGAHLTSNDLFPNGLHDGTRYLAKP